MGATKISFWELGSHNFPTLPALLKVAGSIPDGVIGIFH
jgi:hypothetical protein